MGAAELRRKAESYLILAAGTNDVEMRRMLEKLARCYDEAAGNADRSKTLHSHSGEQRVQ